MAPIFLVDLDDTLFRSRRKLPGFTDGQLTLGARVLDPDAPASKHSYMTPTQKALVDWLLRTTQVIPVTARGTDSYANVQIPFSSYAIVANGAVILDPDGKPDAEWRDMVEAQLLPFADYFSELLDAARAKSADLGVSMRCWPVLEDGVATYLVFKENDSGDGSRLQEIVPVVDREGWIRHHNGNNLALIPPVISKRLATNFLLDRFRADEPDRPVFGLGDSTSDMSYMSVCDWWGAPRESQLTDLVTAALSAR
ncbi:hypothetical protein [Rhizobium leguminosarum]|uniref:HAD family hydrolase n=1 Tax=Rhizobium leguminosarum TaxID=384 RepID=A0A1B1CL78_RHILE|nr:hypothetical protein [Rhizobium leguminosarum]ANP90535.1 hypothetical protein BA011_31910 [Rhizobium leguminosarum]